MLKAMLLSYDETQIEREELTSLVDSCADIVNWMTVLTSSFILISEKTPQEISQFLVQTRDKPFRHILVPITARAGWLPKTAWEFVKKPKAVE